MWSTDLGGEQTSARDSTVTSRLVMGHMRSWNIPHEGAVPMVPTSCVPGSSQMQPLTALTVRSGVCVFVSNAESNGSNGRYHSLIHGNGHIRLGQKW